MTIKAEKHKRTFLLCFAVMLLSVCMATVSNAAAVEWNSGIITLPNGEIASAGRVTGLAFITGALGTANSLWGVSAYDLYVASKTDSPLSNVPISVWDKGDTWMRTGTSDANGRVVISDGISGLSEFATILYTCVVDNQEYYMAVDGGFNQTSYLLEIYHRTNNLASYGTWVVGNSIPEPTSGLLLIIGLSALALRRKNQDVRMKRRITNEP